MPLPRRARRSWRTSPPTSRASSLHLQPRRLALPSNPNLLSTTPERRRRRHHRSAPSQTPVHASRAGATASPPRPAAFPSFFPCISMTTFSTSTTRVHRIDSGGIAVMSPSEDSFGAYAGGSRDRPRCSHSRLPAHARSSTIHLWRDSSSIPQSAILDPEEPPAGIDPREGFELYFLDEPPEGLLNPEATIGRNRRHSRAARASASPWHGSNYTLKVASHETLRNFSLLEAGLTSWGKTGRERAARPRRERLRAVGTGHLRGGSGRACRLRGGAFVFLPEGSDYSFEVSSQRARVLIVAAPSEMEQEAAASSPRRGQRRRLPEPHHRPGCPGAGVTQVAQSPRAAAGRRKDDRRPRAAIHLGGGGLDAGSTFTAHRDHLPARMGSGPPQHPVAERWGQISPVGRRHQPSAGAEARRCPTGRAAAVLPAIGLYTAHNRREEATALLIASRPGSEGLRALT